jgi:hypothetical protein
MKIKTPKCPECREPPKGTLENVLGIAQLTDIGPDGSCEYSGYTDIIWDTQRTLGEGDKMMLVCREGHEWTSAVDYT